MRTRLAVSALALMGILAVPATAAAPKKVTNEGVGKVKLGATHSELREQGLVGAVGAGMHQSAPWACAPRNRWRATLPCTPRRCRRTCGPTWPSVGS